MPAGKFTARFCRGSIPFHAIKLLRAASIIYFLHPTLVPPFNTAMVNGFNVLFGTKKTLGSWESYLEMREVIVHTNDEVRDYLSKDLGALAGLLFEIGSGRFVIDGNAAIVLQQEKEKAARLRHAAAQVDHGPPADHRTMTR